MELRHLRYFLAVAEALSFTRAATQLGVAQPALSRQVRDLEDEIGVDLLRRSPRGVTLTAEGRLFLVETREVLLRTEQAVARTRALARGEYGELHIGYAPSPTVEILPPAIAAFQMDAPQVKVVLHDLAGDEIVSGLLDGSLDLAVMVQPTDESSAGLVFEELRRYPFRVACAPGHPFARMKTVSMQAIAAEPLVALRRRDYSEHYRILQKLFSPHKLRPRVAVECDGASSLITEVEVGRGVAIVSDVFRQVAGRRLAYRPISNTEEAHVVGIAHATKGHVTPAGEKFREVLRRMGVAKTKVRL